MTNPTILIPIYPSLSGGDDSLPPSNSMIATAGSDVFQVLSPLGDGQIYIGSSNSPPQPGNITGSGGVLITNTPGGINIGAIPGVGVTLQQAFDNGTGTIEISPFKNLYILDDNGAVINSFLNTGSTCRQNVIYVPFSTVTIDITNLGSLIVETYASNPVITIVDETISGLYAINACFEVIADGAAGTTIVTSGSATFMDGSVSFHITQYQMARFIRKQENIWYYELTGNPATTGGGGPPTGAAGGDLSGTYPNPTVSQIKGSPLGSTTPTSGNILIGSGTQWVTNPVSGAATLSSSGVFSLATVNSNVGTFGSSTQVGIFTVNAQGLITAASDVTISGVSPAGAAGGDLSGTYPNPTVSKINTIPVTSSTVSDGQILIGSTSASNYTAGVLTGTTNQIIVTNASHSITLSTPQAIATSSSPTFSNLTLSGIAINSLVATNGSNLLVAASGTYGISISGNAATATTTTTATNATNSAITDITTNATFYPAWVSATTGNLPLNVDIGLTYNPNTKVLTTTTFNGNATTATTATNATNVATTAVVTNASFFPLFVASSSNSNQAHNLSTGFTFNPSTNILSTTGLNLSGLSISSLVATDGSRNLTSSVSGLSPTFTGLTLSGLSSGSVLFAGSSGVISQNNSNFFWNNSTIGLGIGTNTFDFTGVNFQITTNSVNGTSAIIRSSLTGSANQAALYICRGDSTNGNALVRFQTGTAGVSADWDVGTLNSGLTTSSNFVMSNNSGNWFILSNTGVLNLPQLTASSLVATNSSKNLISTNTLSSTVLGNITKVTRTILSSGSGTYNTPANATHLRARVWGSGAGGGGAATAAASSGGGNGGTGGGYSEIFISSPLATYAYTIDAGGAGGAAGANNGVSGGTTTFGTSLISITGGTGGGLRNAGTTFLISNGGSAAGGVASGGDININGGVTIGSMILSATVACSGPGGNGALGGAGGGQRNGASNGSNGNVPGGGGSGGLVINGSASASGGNGAAGLIVIEEYYNG